MHSKKVHGYVRWGSVRRGEEEDERVDLLCVPSVAEELLLYYLNLDVFFRDVVVLILYLIFRCH